MYLPTLVLPFFIDDYRNQRLMGEFRAGERPTLDLYRFFTSNTGNAADRAAGYAPWWTSDRLRFEYQRPLTEWSLYAGYRIFPTSPAAQRAIGIAIYLACVLGVLELFRAVGAAERVARWAALIFAVASCHAVPVVFIAARCDLLALLATIGCVLCGLRFGENGRTHWSALCLLCYAAGLLSKEAAFPSCVAFLCAAWAANLKMPESARRDHLGRSAAMFLSLALMAGAWLYWHRSVGDSINVTPVLDPLRRPLEYLREAPLRVLIYFSSWLLPINPAIFFYHSSGRGPLRIYLAVAVVLLLLAAWRLFPALRRDRTARCFALWPLPFLAILACALPDERLMMLPSIGLCYLGAAWLCGSSTPPTPRARMDRWAPPVLFLILPTLTSLATSAVVYGLETRAAQDLRFVTADAQASVVKAAAASQGTMIDATVMQRFNTPQIFFVNAAQSIHAIWAQDRADWVLGAGSPAFDLLCDLPDVKIEVIDEYTLRLTRRTDAFFDTLLGNFALPAGTVIQAGQAFASRGFEVTVRAVESGFPTELELRFHAKLADPSYYFCHITNDAPPAHWIPKVGEQRTFTAFAKES